MIKVKVKLSLCFNWAPHHEGILGEWRYSSTHSLTSAVDGDEWLASRPGRFTPRESPRYPFIMMIMIIIIIKSNLNLAWIDYRSRDSSVVRRWATGWMIEGSNPGKGWEFFFSPLASRPALGPTQPPIQWERGAVSLGIKRSGCQADHSAPSI
jgi:hypothetical protein